MAGCYGDHVRHAVLLVATACLTMMLANCLTVNFTILCMTRVTYDYVDFQFNVTPDFIDSLDFDFTMPDISLSTTTTTTATSVFKLPNFDVDAELSTALMKSIKRNPDLLLRLLKEGVLQFGETGIDLLGSALDPSKIDFSRLRLNLNMLNGNSTARLLEYVAEKFRTDETNQQMQNISKYRDVTVEDISLINVTWTQINGRRRIVVRPADYDYSNSERSLLFAAIAIGALIAILPVTIAMHKRGTRTTFTIVCAISCIATALCPLAASGGFWMFVVVRVVQGIGFAACLPVIGSVTATWAELTENGLFSGALTSFIQLAPVVTMPMSGLLCESQFGWPMVFYIHALITAFLTAAWWIVYRDIPNRHPQISHAELRVIRRGKTPIASENQEKLPLTSICLSPAVWAIWIAAIANMFAVQMVIVFSPTFLNIVLGFHLVNVGFSAAAPTLLQFVVKIIAGASSDRIRSISETAKVKLFNAIAFVGMATFMVALALTPRTMPHLALFFLIACTAILGFNTGGFFKSSPLVARQYSQFVNAIVQVIMCVALLCDPFIVYAMTRDNLSSQWRLVFIGHALLLLVGTVVFSAFGSGISAAFVGESSVKTASETEAEIRGTQIPLIENRQVKT